MDQMEMQITLGSLKNEDQNKILSLVELLKRNSIKQLGQSRNEFLINRFITLFASGITSTEIFLQYSIRELVEKGFSIREAFILIRELSDQSFKDFPHLSNQEIEQLQYDAELKQLALYKASTIIQNQQNKNLKYILIIGPENRGKTTFILNLINAIYEVNIDSLYRVKKNQQIGTFYDEYLIEMTESISYIFVDFRGIGDVKCDIIGDKNSNHFTTILHYMQDKEILAAFFVNSSSINRLGQDEKYQIQRFFELFHSSFIEQIFLILTYCTDNQPILTVYQSEQSPTPIMLKNIINDYNKAKDNHLPFDESRIFWFGINNNFLYATLEEFPEAILNLLRNYHENSISDSMNVPLEIQDGANLGDQIIVEQDIQTILQQGNQADQGIQISSRKIQQLYYQLMRNCTDKILRKLNFLTYRQNINIQEQKLYHRNLLAIENLITQFSICSYSELALFNKRLNPQFRAVYIQCQNFNKKLEIQAQYGKQILYCKDCQSICHQDCELYTFEDLAQVRAMCSKIQVNFRSFNQMQITSRKIAVEKLDSLYYCKVCVNRDWQKQTNNSAEVCLLSNHDLFQEVILDQSIDIFSFNRQCLEQFYADATNYKKQKKLLRLEQSNQFRKQAKQLSQIQVIQDKIAQLTKNSEGLIPLQLFIRYKQLKEINKAQIEEQSPEFQNACRIYAILCKDEIKKEEKQIEQLMKSSPFTSSPPKIKQSASSIQKKVKGVFVKLTPVRGDDIA